MNCATPNPCSCDHYSYGSHVCKTGQYVVCPPLNLTAAGHCVFRVVMTRRCPAPLRHTQAGSTSTLRLNGHHADFRLSIPWHLRPVGASGGRYPLGTMASRQSAKCAVVAVAAMECEALGDGGCQLNRWGQVGGRITTTFMIALRRRDVKHQAACRQNRTCTSFFRRLMR